MNNLSTNGAQRWGARLLGLTLLGLTMVAGGSPIGHAGEEGADWVPEAVFAPVLGGDLKQGYILRADTWDGRLGAGETKPIRHQFVKGNDYRLYASTNVPGAVSVHIYDQDGNLAEGRSWKKEEGPTCFAGVDFKPSSTATYYLILKVDKAPSGSAAWNMAYSYK